uniref:Uncharacterized protein n=1 Tax=Helianthus annuus TaxID=4232 RepID=A0A251SBX6_HELAN
MKDYIVKKSGCVCRRDGLCHYFPLQIPNFLVNHSSSPIQSPFSYIHLNLLRSTSAIDARHPIRWLNKWLALISASTVSENVQASSLQLPPQPPPPPLPLK